MESIWKSYLRWRHSRGYGVHSPFAYRFVKDVVRPGNYGYYALDELDRLMNIYRIKGRNNWKLLSFLIRLCRFLKIKRIMINPGWNDMGVVLSKALKSGLFIIKPDRHLSFKDGDMLIIDGQAVTLSILDTTLSAGIPILVLNPDKKLRNLMEQPMSDGVKFEWRDKILMIPRREMSHVSYMV